MAAINEATVSTSAKESILKFKIINIATWLISILIILVGVLNVLRGTYLFTGLISVMIGLPLLPPLSGKFRFTKEKGSKGALIFIWFVVLAIGGSSSEDTSAEKNTAPQTKTIEPEKHRIASTAKKASSHAIELVRNHRFSIREYCHGTAERANLSYEGYSESIKVDNYVKIMTSHIPNKHHYGWEARKNPFGNGTIVAYSTWMMSTDPTKNYYCMWLVDDNGRIVGGKTLEDLSLILAMTEKDMNKMQREDYEQIFLTKVLPWNRS